MRVIVHAGLNKTGSTSLQAYCHQVRAEFADAGVIYPDLGGENHWRIVSDLLHDGARRRMGYLVKRKAKQGSAGVLDVLADAIRRCRREDWILLLSHENFGICKRLTNLERFIAAVDPEATVTVIGYCREPVALYRSSVQHGIRVSGSYPDLVDWQSGHATRVRNLRAMLGDRLTIRCSAREVLHGGDVVEDFRTVLQAETGRTAPQVAGPILRNAALSAEACGMILEAADRAEPPEAAVRYRNAVAAYDRSRSSATRLELPARFADPIRAENRVEWNRAVEELDHSDEEKERLRYRWEGPIPRVRPRMFDRWLRSHVTPEYRAGFNAYAKDHGRACAPLRKRREPDQVRGAST